MLPNTTPHFGLCEAQVLSSTSVHKQAASKCGFTQVLVLTVRLDKQFVGAQSYNGIRDVGAQNELLPLSQRVALFQGEFQGPYQACKFGALPASHQAIAQRLGQNADQPLEGLSKFYPAFAALIEPCNV